MLTVTRKTHQIATGFDQLNQLMRLYRHQICAKL